MRGVDFDRLREQLSRSVGRVCPRWLADRRDDIVHAGLLRALEIFRSRESNDDIPASYVWKVAYTATIDEIRRVRRRREVPLEDTVPADVGGPVAADDPFDARVLRELGAATLACLARLQERRRVVVGFHLLGHGVREIVDLLAWNEKKIRNLLHRGLADLRRCVAGRGIEP